MPYVYTKLDDLKNRARRIAREEGVPRHEALALAARRGGFQNYAHARAQLPAEGAPLRCPIEIRQRWRSHGREPRLHGLASYVVWLGAPLNELVRSHQLAGYLGGCTILGENVLVSDGFMRDRKETQIDLGKIARALQFMDATGLKPSRAKRLYPKGRWDNRPPIADHDHGWYDPEARVHVLSTEPYSEHAEERPEQKAWEQRHGWTTLRVEWGSIYGFGTELLLLCPQDYAPTLRRKVARLEQFPAAIRTDDIPVEDGMPRQNAA
ncbi:hypothetical protein TPR58_12355 [Sphingomonas sp. HF-S3]|uniref:DUF559 domain-containing protein n=1 Tax=Sphingomonas rustica TaxID=3103142 RepID=A0ABV0B9X8_9SPHN